MPSPLSVTADSEPVPVSASATTPAELERSLPAASFSRTVIALVLDPFATIDAGEAVIVLVRVEAAPAAIV